MRNAWAMAAWFVAVAVSTGVAGAANVLLYCPYDSSADAAYSASGAPDARAAVQDALLLLKKARFEPGVIGKARAFVSSGVSYAVAGNLKRDRGALAMWVQPTWDGTNTTDYCTFFGLPLSFPSMVSPTRGNLPGRRTIWF